MTKNLQLENFIGPEVMMAGLFKAGYFARDNLIWGSKACLSTSFWNPLLMEFVGINFDGNVHDISDNAGYVIRDANGRLLVARGFFLHEHSIPEAELGAI